MIYEWEAQNILYRSISYDILGVLTMDMVYWFFNYYKWVGNTHYFHGFGLITHPILMINEWEAKNNLTRSIGYDILRVIIKDTLYWYY
jgi:hypothetical protein